MKKREIVIVDYDVQQKDRFIRIVVHFTRQHYILSVSPMTKELGGMWSTVLGTSRTQELDSAKRFSQKRLNELAKIYHKDHADVIKLRDQVIADDKWA